MKYMTIFLVLLAGCSESYRFPCQDPANWNKVHCNPPVCEADGTCTKYLIKEEKNEN
jgi:hypothetical protein